MSDLRTLHLREGSILPLLHDSSFPHLDRLILGRGLFPSGQGPIEETFLQSGFPSLRHLSLIEFRPCVRLDRILAPLLPQLESLAIYEPHSSSFERLLLRLNNCRHLALHCRLEDLARLLKFGATPSDHTPPMRLESLHIESFPAEELRGLFSKISEDAARIVPRRTILYGNGAELEGTTNADRFEWRSKGKIYFEEFDGR